MVTQPHTFGGNPLDRAAIERRDPAWVGERLDDPNSRFLPFWRLNILATKAANPPTLVWLGREIKDHIAQGSEPVLLGLLDDVAHFAVDVSSMDDPAAGLSLQSDVAFTDVRAIASQLSMEDAAIAAHGRAFIGWHARHRHCSVCGAQTTTKESGLVRTCGACKAEHFPRTDPVVIMLVSDGTRCLLGRQKAWPEGMFSALAGFVDQGETIEEAVAREIGEETGIQVANVRYHSSQPWPFPSSLMIGCMADAATDTISIDEHELDDARWFSRDEIRAALNGSDSAQSVRLPGPMAIAYQLIKAWSET